MVSAALGLAAAVAVYVLDVGLFAALGLGFAAGLGVPRWALTYLKRRRENLFIDRFPDAIDVVVRGIKSGLPLGERSILSTTWSWRGTL